MVAAAAEGSTDVVPFWKQAMAFTIFALFNLSLNFFNSWALREGGDINGTMGASASAHIPGLGGGGVDFSFFFTSCHMVATAFAAYLLMLTCAPPKTGTLPTFSQLWQYKYQLFPIGFLGVFNTGFNNWSLARVTLFVNQVIKIISPVPTATFEWLIAGKTYNLPVYACVVVLTGGCILSMWHLLNESGDRRPEVDGIVLCLISLLAASLKPVLQKILMTTSSKTDALPPLSPEQLIFWDATISFFGMVIFGFAKGEHTDLIEYFGDRQGNPNAHWLGLAIVAFASFLAFIFNLSLYYFIMYTSALSSSIGSNGIKIFSLLLSAIQAIAGGLMSLGWDLVLGNVIVVLSIIAYARFSHLFKQEQLEQEKAKATKVADESTPLARP